MGGADSRRVSSALLMATLDVPQEYLELAPLVVTSPTTRCGTTLVQRLISSSDNAFVYGEDIGHQIHRLTEQFLAVMRHCDQNRDTLDEDFHRALAGTLNEWRPGLAPPAGVMLKAWVSTYYQLPATLAGFGQAMGRPIWGFKWPGVPEAGLRAIQLLMPRARIVYLVRHPADALKSAKARKFVKTAEDADAYCRAWAANLRAARTLRDDPRMLWMRYEDLLADKAGAVARLSAFAALTGVRMEVFEVKLNTFAGDPDQGHSPTQYIAPARLTAADREAVDRHAGALIDELYADLGRAR